MSRTDLMLRLYELEALISATRAWCIENLDEPQPNREHWENLKQLLDDKWEEMRACEDAMSKPLPKPRKLSKKQREKLDAEDRATIERANRIMARMDLTRAMADAMETDKKGEDDGGVIQ